ncbi:MAG: TlpA family protein disulfide reductase [Sphingobacteriales bacterium]|nr:TlpA family protein disulfide reductase [Sphingobacteriales bacterium]
MQIKLDQNATVKNTDGQEYPYAVWYKLFQSGKYGVKLTDAKDPQKPVFVIYEMSQQEIEDRNARMPKPMDSGAFKEGDDFNYFTFRDTDNQKFKLEDLKGKILVVNYWFINCPPCRQEIPDLNALVYKYKDNPKVLFVAVGLDPWYELKDFLKTTPFNYHFVTDGRYIANSFKISGYPTNVVVDTKGKVVFQSKGGSPANSLWIEKSIEAALSE